MTEPDANLVIGRGLGNMTRIYNIIRDGDKYTIIRNAFVYLLDANKDRAYDWIYGINPVGSDVKVCRYESPPDLIEWDTFSPDMLIEYSAYENSCVRPYIKNELMRRLQGGVLFSPITEKLYPAEDIYAIMQVWVDRVTPAEDERYDLTFKEYSYESVLESLSKLGEFSSALRHREESDFGKCDPRMLLCEDVVKDTQIVKQLQGRFSEILNDGFLVDNVNKNLYHANKFYYLVSMTVGNV